jgi:hypothetical protein
MQIVLIFSGKDTGNIPPFLSFKSLFFLPFLYYILYFIVIVIYCIFVLKKEGSDQSCISTVQIGLLVDMELECEGPFWWERGADRPFFNYCGVTHKVLVFSARQCYRSLQVRAPVQTETRIDTQVQAA